MKCFDLIGELCDQPIIQLAAGGNFLEQGPVSKAYHFEEPVDGVSLPVQVQLASAIPGNGANRKIERWRRPAVERQFCVQRGMTFVRTRKVEIVVIDGSLELPGAIAGQEYVRRMCIDPARGFARREGARRLQEGDDIGLLFGLADRSCRRRHLRSMPCRSRSCDCVQARSRPWPGSRSDRKSTRLNSSP